MSRSEFELNTAAMDSAAKECRLLAQTMRNLEQDLRRGKSRLAFSWKGNGCNAFEIQFRLMVQQLSDLADNLWDKGEEILAAECAYRQADVEGAKRMDGIQSAGSGL